MDNEIEYLKQSHHLSQTAIGLARYHLQQNNSEEAKKILDKCCTDLDEITVKYLPSWAKLLGLKE